MINDKIGYNDLPISIDGQDKLGMMSYVNGFSEFLENCSTPITVSISGEWGSGKTSFMNLVNLQLQETGKFKYMTFPVWMYNTVSMDSLTSILFLEELTYNLIDIHGSQSQTESEEKTIELKKSLTELIKRIKEMKYNFNFMVQNPFFKFEVAGEEDKGGESSSYLNNTNTISEVRLINQYKESLNNLVEKILGKNENLLIFIDDLDRLKPIVAIELLEIIKMFLDIDKVIFVLAIDFDVVKQGVKDKYGDLEDKNPEDYFEKMIQVNYSMPVERYKSDEMYKQYFENSIDLEIKQLVDYCIPAIPRKIKKFLNNFLLVKAMYGHTADKDEAKEQNKVIKAVNDEILLLVEAIRQKDEALYFDLVKSGVDLKTYVGTLDNNYVENYDSDSEGQESVILEDCRYYLKKIVEGQDKKFIDDLVNVLQFTRDMEGEAGVTLYKYKDGKMYDAYGYTMKFQEEFKTVFENNQEKFEDSIDIDRLIGNGSVRDVLTNTII